jgi:hypothetical protein
MPGAATFQRLFHVLALQFHKHVIRVQWSTSQQVQGMSHCVHTYATATIQQVYPTKQRQVTEKQNMS